MTESMTGTFLLPDLGEGLNEAEIINWHVAPGDRVVADQPLVTVENRQGGGRYTQPRQRGDRGLPRRAGGCDCGR